MQDPRKHQYSCSCVKTKKHKRKCHIKTLRPGEKVNFVYMIRPETMNNSMCYISYR